MNAIYFPGVFRRFFFLFCFKKKEGLRRKKERERERRGEEEVYKGGAREERWELRKLDKTKIKPIEKETFVL